MPRGAPVQALYFVRAAARGLVGSPVTTGVATVTIALSLVLVGGFLVISTNMGRLLARAERELAVTAYLTPGLSEREIEGLAARVSMLPGVEGVELVTPEQALERFRERLGGGQLLEGLDRNPLPPSLVVRLAADHRSPEALDALVAALEPLPGVEDFGVGAAWMESYARVLALIRAFGWGLGAVLALATLLIVANTIRLAVYARSDELGILALVGASRAFRRIPFLIEGGVQGAAGGTLALLGTYALYRLALPRLGPGLELFLGGVPPTFLDPSQMLALVAYGALLGLLGAASALFWERLP